MYFRIGNWDIHLASDQPITDLFDNYAMKIIDDWGFYLIAGTMVAVMSILVITDSMPEKAAAHFNVLTDVSIPTNYMVLHSPTPENNVLVYAVNEMAAKAIPIAERDPAIKEIIASAQESRAAITIAAIQPTVYEFRSDGQISHSAVGVLTITVNKQYVDNRPYLQASGFEGIEGKEAYSYQKVWRVIVDLNRGAVTDIQETSVRQMAKTLQSNTVYIGTNMFMPGSVRVEQGTTLKWVNTSDLPHNIMGIYSTASGKKIPVDSGFMQNGGSWKYTFDEEGTFEYHCTTHSGDGMKGTIAIS